MSDLFYFLSWFACVFNSALCVAGLTRDHWHFESAATNFLLPLCLSFMLGSLLFLGLLKLRVEWRSYVSLMQSNSMARISETDRVAARNVNYRPSWFALDSEAKGG
jgi:hypothetical protein